MPNIQPIDQTSAPAEAAELLSAVKQQLGMVPNIFGTMAHSPAVLGAYLSFATAIGGGALPAKLREQIALAVAGENACDYCASAHSALGSQHGLSSDEVTQNLRGRATDPKSQAALRFATRVVAARGNISDGDLEAVRNAGYSDGEVIEIIGHVALNLFTNYFNHIAGTEIDFPVVRTSAAAAA